MGAGLATDMDVMAVAAPRVKRLSTVVQDVAGTSVVDMDSRVGIVVLTLRANNLGLLFSEEPKPGQVMVLAVRQGIGAPFTWAPHPSMLFAGQTFGPTSTVQNRRDIYTMIYDGTNWNEVSRAMGVG